MDGIVQKSSHKFYKGILAYEGVGVNDNIIPGCGKRKFHYISQVCQKLYSGSKGQDEITLLSVPLKWHGCGK